MSKRKLSDDNNNHNGTQDNDSKKRKLDGDGDDTTPQPPPTAYDKYEYQRVKEVAVTGCIHKVCYPPHWTFPETTTTTEDDDADDEYTFDASATEQVIKYPYELDIFQKQGICGINHNENVLVAAHTSAGKTTVAQYAIAKCLQRKERVIYTSPIKALSNQKYRELSEKFLDVGLMTGDTTINRDAGCLVMTTEILRNMLYRGAEIIREISWIIFDEIHYMKDPHRGVVWEETLILLPSASHFVFLSATIPNSTQFAKWIAKINGAPCHVIYTEFRPVPLQHYLFPKGGEGIYLCVDHASKFKEANFQRALNAIKMNHKNDDSKSQSGNSKKKTAAQSKDKDIFKLIQMIMQREFDPCIVFAFSKKEVEHLALSLSKLDFTSGEEKKLISQIFNNGIATLCDDDRLLPQIQSLLHLLQRGIGIHHSGLLPILKELVEILFGEGLIRVLFTTETFAMGVNFPAKCVIFSAVMKWDGAAHRLLTSSEYIQMSGRAGRRGLDERGIVIMMVHDDKLQPSQIQSMLQGESTRLVSQFHVTYPMLIQLKRLQDIEPHFIIHRSFMQFQKLDKIPSLQRKCQSLESKIAHLSATHALTAQLEATIERYLLFLKSQSQLYEAITQIVNTPQHLLQWLNAGRLLLIAQPRLNRRLGWCICVGYKKLSHKDLSVLRSVYKQSSLQIEYVVDVVTPDARIISVQLHHVQQLSAIRLNMSEFKNLSTHAEHKHKLSLVLQECLKRNSADLKPLHPIQHLHITHPKLQEYCEKLENVQRKIVLFREEHGGGDSGLDLDALCVQYQAKKDLLLEVDCVQSEIVALENNEHIEQKLGAMYRVLRRLKMIDADNDVITIKGKIACELSCGDELILTELLFSNFLTQLDCDYINALLSCFVYDEVLSPTSSSSSSSSTAVEHHSSKFGDELNEKLYKQLREKIVAICELQKECKLELNSKKYIESFGNGLMDVALSWSRGAKFSEISGKMTAVYEGTIIRVLKRLDELLSELLTCSKLVGNDVLTKKLTICKQKIKRDIVFSSSLYL